MWDLLGEYIWEQHLWWMRMKEEAWKSERSWTVAITTEASADPTGSSGAGIDTQNCSSWGKRDLYPAWNSYWMQAVPSKAASSCQEHVLEGTQLWALSSKYTWQLGEWVSGPEGASRWHGFCYIHPILVASHTHHFPSLCSLFFFKVYTVWFTCLFPCYFQLE